MSGRDSAARYARALLDVAIKEADPEQAGLDLRAFADLVSGSHELRDVFANPAVSAANKQHIVSALIDRQQPTAPVGKLLLMLAERGRLALLPDLVDVYQERLMEHQQIVRAEVTTATPLGADQEDRLRERLAQATGRRVTMTTKVDPALIGGVVARIGSTVYDGSVATQLEKMREQLLQER